ncbi:MFS transporter [Phycicoccus sp. 3266]|uniref:MFS transporter n=1 Tax=Phycicoccus sp. 3266 TaxID=2817751 RepID=UPI002854A6C2|nr:MFS transporter [Phycicoccus sp. 3266]MDR6861887.1 MFS family permease [Phycicoccus sp. 3266]
MTSPAPTARTTAAGAGGGVFGPAHALVSLALVALITVIAFEGMAVSTAMPQAARELDAVRSYGLAFSVMLTTQLLGIVLAGVWCDRSGPLPSLYAGQLLFAAGCAVCGASGTFGLFLVGRGVAGLGAGLIIVAGYVVIGRVYPDSLRPKVFSVISAAWVLPSLLGPPIAAWVTTTWSWRWVFWLVVAPVVLAMTMVLSRRAQIAAADDGIDASSRDHRAHTRAAWFGLLIAASAGALQWGTHDLSAQWSVQTAVAVVGVAGIAVAAPLLLPAGTWLLRRGLPSVMLARFLLTCSFFGTITYIPLMLVNERGQSLGTAGTILAVGSLGWSAGSWVQGRDRWAGRRDHLVVAGGVLLTAGLLGVVAVTHFAWHPWLIALALVACGTGMGLGTASLSVLSLTLTPPADHGATSSSLQLADVLGSVIGIAAAGAVFAALHTRAGQDVPVFVGMWLGLSAVAACVVLAGSRIRAR